MGLRTKASSPPEETARLLAGPDGDPGGLIAGVDDSGGVEDVREDLALLCDAALLVTARRSLDGPLLLLVNPFDLAAYPGLGSYSVGPSVLALAAYGYVTASAVRGA